MIGLIDVDGKLPNLALMKYRGIDMKEIILQKIISYIKEHGYPPTFREIGEMVALKSTSSVHRYLNKMFELGMLETDVTDNSPRALRVPGYKFVKVESE